MEVMEAQSSQDKTTSMAAATLEANTWRMAEDVVECIVERLSLRDICALRLCSHFFFSLCGSDHIWIQLFKQRWPCLNRLQDKDREEGNKMGECTVIGPCRLHVLHKLPNQGWKQTYANFHVEMRTRAKSVIELVRKCSQNESVEVYNYQKAMALLSGLGLGFQDVMIFLLTPAQGVLLNLIGLHFSLVQLHTQSADLKVALERNSIGSRQVCLRWWTMGGWANGFRRRDEMHICTASLDELTDPAHKHLLNVMERGTIHEVLRVQISADFKSSAWVS